MVRQHPVVLMAQFRGIMGSDTEDQCMVLEADTKVNLTGLVAIAELDGWRASK